VEARDSKIDVNYLSHPPLTGSIALDYKTSGTYARFFTYIDDINEKSKRVSYNLGRLIDKEKCIYKNTELG
jgi:hypothetical protein